MSRRRRHYMPPVDNDHKYQKIRGDDRMEVPMPRCTKCDSTEFVVYKTLTREISGEDSSGRMYNAVCWRYVRCVCCGQRAVHISRRLVIFPVDGQGPGKT